MKTQVQEKASKENASNRTAHVKKMNMGNLKAWKI